MWVGLALLLGDCFSELGLLVVQTALQKSRQQRSVSRLRLGSRRLQGGTTDMIALLSGGSRDGYMRLTATATEQGLGAPGVDSAGRHAANPLAAACLELSPSSSVGALEGCEAGSSFHKAVIKKHEEQPQQQQEGDLLLLHTGSTGQSASPATSSHLGTSTDADAGGYEAEEDTDHSGNRDQGSWFMSSKFWIPGLLLSTLLSTGILSPLLGMPMYEPLVAVVLALLVALLAVRALGQTDLNPVSGVGKISQVRWTNTCKILTSSQLGH